MTTFPQLLPVSAEFTALCQQQLRLLVAGIGADWSILYLAQPNHLDQAMELRAISACPDRFLAAGKRERDHYATGDADWLADLPLTDEEGNGGQELMAGIGDSSTAFPLFHEDLILGILTTGRRDRAWRSPEVNQIQLISQSLALACVLDQQKSWATQQLAQQQHLQALEQEHFHDLLHQLRNPTMAIGTFGKLLLKRLTAEDRNYTVAEGVVRESDRLKALLQDFGEEVKFLDAQIQAIPATQTLALPSGGESAPLRLGQTLVIETVDLRSLVLPIVESMAAIASERDLALQVALEPEPVLVLGNANGLIEVVSNLLENALKYTPSGGQILLAMQTLPQGVRLAVHDTGYGIPSEDLAHVFERHYRGAQAAGEIPGTGLGLAIARDFVEKMGGDLEVESPTIGLPHDATYPGSSFILWLKAAPQNAPTTS